MIMRVDRCQNYNHGRSNPPVGFCPMCGEVVNSNIPKKICSEEKHGESRRKRNKFCVDCGEQLIQNM